MKKKNPPITIIDMLSLKEMNVLSDLSHMSKAQLVKNLGLKAFLSPTAAAFDLHRAITLPSSTFVLCAAFGRDAF